MATIRPDLTSLNLYLPPGCGSAKRFWKSGISKKPEIWPVSYPKLCNCVNLYTTAMVWSLHQATHGNQAAHGQRAWRHSRERRVIKTCQRVSYILAPFGVRIVLVKVDFRAHALHVGQLCWSEYREFNEVVPEGLTLRTGPRKDIREDMSYVVRPSGEHEMISF